MGQPLAPTSAEELKALVSNAIARNGSECDLNHIDVSGITDFRYLFEKSNFNGEISQWNVGRGITFMRMFAGSAFNGDISSWDTASAESMQQMFFQSQFNGDVSRWNTSKLEIASGMFCDAPFDGDLSRWTFAPNVEHWGEHGLLALVSHSGTSMRQHLALPLLPVECSRLFLATPRAMHDWLGERLFHGQMSRYHWDALLREPTASWASAEMRAFAKTYLSLTPTLPASCVEHSALCMNMWVRAQEMQGVFSASALPLPDMLNDGL